MNKETQSIIRNLQKINSGEPWYGRSVYEILEEVRPAKALEKPLGGHSLLELLYHMLTWTEFTVKRIEGSQDNDLSFFEKIDWREIDPAVHTWEKGLAQFKSANERIIDLLTGKNDEFLGEIVDYRRYNFRFLLNGLIQHHIYHLGQIAYINKYLV